jgi:ech hydrogenase subunit D
MKEVNYMDEQTLIIITPNEILSEVLTLYKVGYRLVAITCTNKEGMEMTYSFDKDYELINIRFTTDTETEINSISTFYSYAFLYENEIKELFGVQIKDISIDFMDNLYKIPMKTPFGNKKEEE